MRTLLHEHNTVNSFWLVLVEFILVGLAALFVGAAEFAKESVFWSVAYLGVAVNAGVICATVVEQLRRGERGSSLAASYSAQGRESIRREHPHLDRHTFQIVAATLTPFLLAALTVLDR